jgi:hypothetical protein
MLQTHLRPQNENYIIFPTFEKKFERHPTIYYYPGWGLTNPGRIMYGFQFENRPTYRREDRHIHHL